MKTCPHCGNALQDDAKFCDECGQPLPEGTPVVVATPAEASADAPAEPPVVTAAETAQEAQEAPVESEVAPVPVLPVEAPTEPQEASVNDAPVITQIPSRRQMLSTFQYILLSLLYGLPVIGLVFLFVFGAGHPKNPSLKRFSAAMLILRLVFWIVLLALLIVAMVKNGRLLADAMGQLIPAVESLLKVLFA